MLSLFLELVPRVAAALFLAGGHFLTSYLLAARLLPGARPLLRWCGTFVVGLSLATAAFHALVPFHLFRLPVALGGMALVLAAVLGPAGNRDVLAALARGDLRLVRRVTGLIRRSPRRGWLVAFAICAAVVVLRPLVVAPVSWDGMMYHAMKAALWVQHGGPALVLDRGVPSWDLTRNTLAGGEVFNAWAMLPMHGDLLYGAVQSVQWLALGVATIALARELGVREPYATVAAGLLLSLPPVRLEVGSGYVEIVLALTLVTGLLFTIHALRRGSAGAILLAAASLGLACGIKIIAIPLCGIVLLFLAAGAVRHRSWRALAAGALVWAALATPWPIYNTLDTGAPLSPTPITAFGIELGRASDAIQHMLDQPTKPYDLDREWASLKITFDAPAQSRETLGVLALLPLGVFLACVPLLARRRPGAAGMMLAAFAANLAIVYGPTFTTLRQRLPEGVSRFLVPALVIAVPASVTWCAAWPRAGRLYFTVLLGSSFFLLLRFVTLGQGPEEATDLLVVLALVLGLALLGRAVPRGAARVAAVAGATIVALAWFNLFRDSERHTSTRDAFLLHPMQRGWVDAARILDDLDNPTRIAITHGVNSRVDNGLFYMMLGRRLQNELVYVPPSKDGSRIFDTLTERRRCDYTAWVERLIEAKVDYVVSIEPETIELDFMESNPSRFKLVNGLPRLRGLFKFRADPRATLE